LEHLGLDVSLPWLYGGTGHAFVLNIAGALCPSGPTCWNWQKLFNLTPNLGYRIEGFSIEKDDAGDSFPQWQQKAWDFVRAGIDRGLPCWGWELHPWIPDHYVIYGYDGEEYLYSGWSEGRLPWQKLGDMDVKVLQVYRVEPCDRAPDEKTVRDALATALRLANDPADWTLAPGYSLGPAGFDLWAEELATGNAIRDGHSYNAGVWHECREMAVAFLGEVKQRLSGRYVSALDDAAGHYTVVRDKLTAAVALHPMRTDGFDAETKLQSSEAAALVREAGEAERKAISSLGAVALG
jgi:hypothetical protein